MNLSPRLRTGLLSLFAAGLSLAPACGQLVGFYPFDDTANPLQDASGSGNHLTTGAGATDPTYHPEGGLSGGAHFYNGAQNWVAPIDINPGTLGQLTVGAWVRTTSLNSGLRKVIGHDDGGWDRTIGLDNRNPPGETGSPFRYMSFAGSTTHYTPNDVPGPVSTNDWTLLVAAYDEFAFTVTLYVDINANTVGDEVIVATAVDAFFSPGHETAAIGNLRPDNVSEGWIGYIDNAFFFDRLLTPEEVTRIRNQGTPDLSVLADPNFSALSVPDLAALPKSPAPHTITLPIRNDGASQTLNIQAPTISGADASFYQVTSFPAQLAPGASGAITVVLDPQGQVGRFEGLLTVPTDDSIQPRTTLDLAATIVPDGSGDPRLVRATSEPVFSDFGTSPATATFDLRNEGATGTLNITGASLVGPDAAHYTIDAFPATLAPGATGPVRVTFHAQGSAKGSFTASIRFISNDAASRVTLIHLPVILSRPIRPALIGFYPFDDAGDPFKDESGGLRHLTETADGFSTPSHDPQGGVEGGAFFFDGSTRLIAPIDINPGVLPELTLGAWVRADSLDPGLRKIIGHDNGGWDRVIGLDNRPAPDAPFRYTAFTGNSPGPLELPGPESFEDWTFVAATFNQILNEVVVYVDIDSSSTSDALVSDRAATTYGPGFNTFSIGSINPNSPAEGWVGSIDNVFVYGAILSPEQLTRIRDGRREVILSNDPDPDPTPTAPTIASVSHSGTSLTIVWTSAAGVSYSIEYTESLTPAAWTPIGTQLAEGTSTTYQDADATRLGRATGYYRVVIPAAN